MPVIVTAKKDGRGMIAPFGTFGKPQAGANVTIGEKSYKVTKDGRVNIPKKIMETGIKGDDGKYRISIGFASEKGKEGWKSVKTVIVKPDNVDKNTNTGQKIKRFDEKRPDDLVPSDIPDYSWSPD